MDAFEALGARNTEALMAALAANPAVADTSKDDGTSLLAFAAYMGNADAVAAIKKIKPKLTPYEALITGGDVAEFIADGWDPNARSPDGFTPLALACFFKNAGALDRLLPLTTDINARATNAQQVAALHSAVAVRDDTAVEKLLRAGADPNLPQQQGFRPLHTTAQHGDAVESALLLLFGADPKLANDAGETPADFARKAGHDWLAERLAAL
jgi:ankyrin repeat protein